jgi:hypothetical protein
MTLFKIFHANGALNALNIGAFVQVYKYYKSFTNSVEICLILITNLQKLYNFDEISYKICMILMKYL